MSIPWTLDLGKLKRIIPLCVLILAASLFLNGNPPIQGLLQASFLVSSNGTIVDSSTGVQWLHTSGQNIYDSSGRQVKLYACVIMQGMNDPITQADIQEIKNDGFNFVRWFIYWGQCQPSPTSVTTAYFSLGTGEPSGTATDNIVNWCQTAGLYVLLCVGSTSYWDMPTWARVVGGTISVPDGGSDTNFSTIQSGVNYLYGWLANRYASYSNVIFESLNELQTSAPASDVPRFPMWNDGWISAIEANEGDTSHLKVVQLLYDWSEWNYNFDTPYIGGTHSNVVLATHDYPAVKESATIAANWCTQMATHIQGAGYAWIDTEFSTAIGGTYAGVQQACSLMASHNIAGWGYFCYCSDPGACSDYNIHNPTNAASLLPILQTYMVQP